MKQSMDKHTKITWSNELPREAGTYLVVNDNSITIDLCQMEILASGRRWFNFGDWSYSAQDMQKKKSNRLWAKVEYPKSTRRGSGTENHICLISR